MVVCVAVKWQMGHSAMNECQKQNEQKQKKKLQAHRSNLILSPIHRTTREMMKKRKNAKQQSHWRQIHHHPLPLSVWIYFTIDDTQNINMYSVFF